MLKFVLEITAKLVAVQMISVQTIWLVSAISAEILVKAVQHVVLMQNVA